MYYGVVDIDGDYFLFSIRGKELFFLNEAAQQISNNTFTWAENRLNVSFNCCNQLLFFSRDSWEIKNLQITQTNKQTKHVLTCFNSYLQIPYYSGL